MGWFVSLSPVTQALIGTLFTWIMTAFGAGVVFFFHDDSSQSFGCHAWICGRGHDDTGCGPGVITLKFENQLQVWKIRL